MHNSMKIKKKKKILENCRKYKICNTDYDKSLLFIECPL